MAVSTRSSHRLAVCVVAVSLASVLGLVGCSSSKDDGGADSTTSSIASETPPVPTVPSSDGGSSTTTSNGSTSSTGPEVPASIPNSPSTVPASVDGTCMPLAETIGLDQIHPKDTSSWVDERQRVVVDARREAELLGIAQKNGPDTIAGQLATMQAYATWLANAVEGADNYAAASAAIGA